MSTQLLYQYNPWWEEPYQKSFIARPSLSQKIKSAITDSRITLLTGLRRVGKTTLMKMQIQSLIDSGVAAKNIFYISLDDYQLKDESILDIIDTYHKLHKIRSNVKCYLFLDEITYKEDFRQQLKNLYDRGSNKIIASSSSSSALKDKRGYLTGREQTIMIDPLNFEEYLAFKEISLKKREQNLLESYFEDYLQSGGMPEYVINGNREYLTSLVEDILHKDIISNHSIRNPQVIKDFFALLMERAGKQISLNKVANILGISPDSAKRYLQYFEDTFLIYLVPRYGKTNETIIASKKVYAADLGMRNLITGFRDKGAVFENYVFNLIKHLQPCYVYQNGMEIDFMTENKWLIEAKYNRKLQGKQQELFDSLKAKQKIVVDSLQSLQALQQDISE